MKTKISAIITLIFPSFLAIRLLNLLGHKIHIKAKIGFSWIESPLIIMSENSCIGHLNIIKISSIQMKENASIRNFNRMRGPFNLKMEKRAAIGNNNSIYRAKFPITIGITELYLSELAIITSKHTFDCTCSIFIGDFTTISGFGTQFWTHGFYHENQGVGRIRIDGSIIIGNNVSIGSRCIVNPGVRVGNAINVGGNSCISKSILNPGMYVSQGLRYIPTDISKIKNRLQKNTKYTIVDVYEKSVA